DCEFAEPARLEYSSSITSFAAPDGSGYHFYRGCIAEVDPPPGTDWAILRGGKIAISPIAVCTSLLRDQGIIERMKNEMGKA
ncbi:MAG: hypothetical protein WCL50_13500, partial [Spirochaetota bacterium]